MKKLMLLPFVLVLGGCATYGYGESYVQEYRPAYTVRSYSVPVYDTWLDQPFWTLDPWYYPAYAYRNYSYGVSWVSDWDDGYPYYGYPYYSYTLHYSPIYISSWYDHGYSRGIHGYYGLRDFWWQDSYPYTTHHGARREVSRLQRQHRVPASAHRYNSYGYPRHHQNDRHVREPYTVGYSRYERTRSVRGAHGYEDGHRGRSSINDRHAGERRMPFNHQYREDHYGNRLGHSSRGYARGNHAGEDHGSARRELRRVGYATAPSYSAAPAHTNRPVRNNPVHRQPGHAVRSTGNGLKPAYPVQPAHRPARSTYSTAGHSSRSAPASSERVHRSEGRSMQEHGLPAARQRDHGRSSGPRWPMMKEAH